MEQTPSEESTGNERRGLALSALMMSAVALFCAFIVSWRVFAIFIAAIALITGIYVLSKVKGSGRSKRLSVAAVIISLLAVAVAVCYLATALPPVKQENALPPELQDSNFNEPDAGVLERMQMGMDSTQQLNRSSEDDIL